MSGRWTAGVDFGGTNIKIGLVSGAGRVVATRVLSSRRYGRPAAFVRGVGEAVPALARSCGVRRLAGVGVGAPGPVDRERGVIHTLVNVPGWRNVALGPQLARRLGCRCLIENDVNLFTLGEWRFGAGRGARNLIGVTLGTGVGGGLVIDGRLYGGSSGAAGEIGHMVVDPGGPRCHCGSRGCLEAHVAAGAVVRMGREALRHTTGPLRTIARQAHGRLTSQLIGRAARQGDRAARRIWTEIGRVLGIGLANVVNLLDPDRIVIGGGVANNWSLFYPVLSRTLRAQALPVPGRRVAVVRARLGDHAGILGAATAVLDWKGTHR
jgi:glucokinase